MEDKSKGEAELRGRNVEENLTQDQPLETHKKRGAGIIEKEGR